MQRCAWIGIAPCIVESLPKEGSITILPYVLWREWEVCIEGLLMVEYIAGVASGLAKWSRVIGDQRYIQASVARTS